MADATKRDALAMFGKAFGVIGGGLSGLLVAAIVFVTIRALTIRPGDTAGAMGIGIAFFVLFPLAFIPVGLVCLLGGMLSGLALRRHSSSAARTGLRLSWISAAIAVGVYGIALLIIVVAEWWNMAPPLR